MANAPLWPGRVALDGGGLGEESEVSSARAQGVQGECRTMTLIRRKPPAEGAGSRGGAPGERQTEQRPPRGRRAVWLGRTFTCKTSRPFVSG